MLVIFRPSVLAVSSKKRTSTTEEIPDEIDAKKPKTETADESVAAAFVFKKPLPPLPLKPKKSALEELREVIFLIIICLDK